MFVGNIGYDYGGGIAADIGEYNIISSIFDSNNAIYGGAISIRFSSQVNITDCTMINNYADYGGALYQVLFYFILLLLFYFYFIFILFLFIFILSSIFIILSCIYYYNYLNIN